jgi:hypothetical protein
MIESRPWGCPIWGQWDGGDSDGDIREWGVEEAINFADELIAGHDCFSGASVIQV